MGRIFTDQDKRKVRNARDEAKGILLTSFLIRAGPLNPHSSASHFEARAYRRLHQP